MSAVIAPDVTTRERILDCAESMLQRGGYHGFSFREVAAGIGVKAASIHYHFPSKGDLAQAVLARARQRFEQALADIRATHATVPARLRAFSALFARTLGDADRLCPFCVTATDREALTPVANAEVQAFWVGAERWLAAALEEGRARGELALSASADACARGWVAALEGAMLGARAFGNPRHLAEVVAWLEAGVVPANPGPLARRGRRPTAPPVTATGVENAS